MALAFSTGARRRRRRSTQTIGNPFTLASELTHILGCGRRTIGGIGNKVGQRLYQRPRRLRHWPCRSTLYCRYHNVYGEWHYHGLRRSPRPWRWLMRPLAGLLSGLIFGFGLVLSGMTDRDKVLGFLDVFGNWQPALLLVMGSAVMVTLVGFSLVRRQQRPLFAPSFHFPVKRAIDGRLLGGAALFGIGWGIYGFCPGPAVTALFYGDAGTYYFFAAMIAGMWIANRVESRKQNV